MAKCNTITRNTPVKSTVQQYYTASSFVPSGKPTKITAGAELNVLASISGDGKSILLALNPRVNTDVQMVRYATLTDYEASGNMQSSFDINLPQYRTQELSTRVVVNSGETVVMGGVIERQRSTLCGVGAGAGRPAVHRSSVPAADRTGYSALPADFRHRHDREGYRRVPGLRRADLGHERDSGCEMIFDSVTGHPTKLSLRHMQPPVRRVLALDAGSRQVKLVLAESFFGRIRFLKQEVFDLQAEGLVAPEELKAHLQATLGELGNPALAVVLPQQTTVSQVLDLPTGPESDIRKLIEDETVKLSGVSGSRIIYDFVHTGETPAKNRQHFRVTQGREEDIRGHVARLGLEGEDICEITTCADALVSAFSVAAPGVASAVLVHLGAQTTIVVIVSGGQAAAVTSFPMGSDFFTRSLARASGGAVEAAEALKRGSNLFAGPDVSPEHCQMVDGWIGELQTQVQEWFRSHGESAGTIETFRFVASGGGFDQPGLLDYLEERTGWVCNRGRVRKGSGRRLPPRVSRWRRGSPTRPWAIRPGACRCCPMITAGAGESASIGNGWSS